MPKSDRRKSGTDLDGQFVNPGEIAVVQDGALLITVVSGGVVVCVWEKSGSVAGMAHFVEPRIHDSARATARFGNVALLKLIELVTELAPFGDFEAQIFGGAKDASKNSNAGANVEIAQRILHAKHINLVSEDTGGSKGRKLMFDTTNGHVAVIRVHQLRKEDWQS